MFSFWSTRRGAPSPTQQAATATTTAAAAAASTATRRPPQSPFFKPHVPQQRVIEQTLTTTTPRGKHERRVKTATVVTQDGHDLAREHKSNIVGCAANLMTCIVGSGIVGLPYAMAQTGFVAGIILILVTAALTEKSLRLLVETAKHLHQQTYETAAEVAFGVLGFRFVLVNMFVMAYGAMVTYLMITKSCLAVVFNIQHDNGQEYILLVVSLLVQFPLACMRDMADLEKTSGLAVAIDVTLVSLVAYASPWQTLQGVQYTSIWQELHRDVIHTGSVFVGLGVLSFAFECQEAAFLVAGSLQKPTVGRWAKVTTITLTACLFLSLTCAVTGYLGYGAATKGNVLNNLDPSTTLSLVAHALLGVTMFATYPLASFVARHVCVVLLFEGPQAHQGDDSSILNRPDRRILLTAILYLTALIPATILTDMGKVLALAGVIGGSCLAYIGPGMLYLAVHGDRFLQLVQTFFRVQTRTKTTCIGGKDEETTTTTTNNATESTPLVATTKAATASLSSSKNVNDNKQTINTVVPPFDGSLKRVFWYITGMPLWTQIAHMGKNRILVHAQGLAEKHTLQFDLRIGDVDLTGMENLAHVSKTRSTVVAKHLSDLYDKKHVKHLSGPQVANTEEGEEEEPNEKAIQLKAFPKPAVSYIEPDPQEKPPGRIDFFVAVLYICFGILALFAGLISLYKGGRNEEPDVKTISH